MSRAATLFLVGALALSACSTSAATPTPTATNPAVATPEPTAPPPSPTPVDVSALFVARIVAVTTARLTVSGSLERGSELGAVSGSLTYVGGDRDQTLTTTLGAVTTSTTTVHRGGFGYTKRGDGPWIKDAVAPSAGPDLVTWLRGLTSLVDEGVAAHAGGPAHRLELPAGTAIPATTFGLIDEAIVDRTVELVFFAANDGQPLAIVVTVSGTETLDAVAIPAKMTLDLAFTQIGGNLGVEVPDHVWNRFTSARYHFAIAYPDQWVVDTAQKSDDYLNSPTVAHVGGRRLKSLGLSLGAWAKRIIAVHDAAMLHYTLISNDPYTLGGTEARLLTSEYTFGGVRLICYEVVAVRADYTYDIFWISPVKTKAADFVIYQHMLETYAYT